MAAATAAVRGGALTGVEKALKAVCAVPFAPFGFFFVPAKHVAVVTQFGKVDRLAECGLRWAPVCFANVEKVFVGPQTHAFKGLHLTEKTGTPIVVSVVMNYHVSDAAKFMTTSRGSISVVCALVESHIRTFLQCHALVPPTETPWEACIQRHGDELLRHDCISAQMQQEFGVAIDALKVVQADYSPDMAQLMLLKQQAQALVEARGVLVRGVMGVVQDAAASYDAMLAGDGGGDGDGAPVPRTPADKERFIAALAVTLCSANSVVPTVTVGAVGAVGESAEEKLE